MFGANPWKLMQWMGHKRVDETMLYVHVAEAHLRPHPELVIEAQRTSDDPDQRVVAMLGARHAAATRCAAACRRRANAESENGREPKDSRPLSRGADGTRTRGLRRDRPAL